jgi:dipeptidyl aminopeptidase/acylaminoacyl peptidase
VPVVVTHPRGVPRDRPLPAVVVVHGGPWVRGASLRWNEQAQFLASAGIRVIEPNFRGSTGFGFKHFKAGWKQWGGAMQDDLADAVKWAAEMKLIDPSRVCVAGASYGGYAALMAPIAHPGVFRCAAAFAAVTDLDLLYDIAWSDLSEEHRRYGMPTLVGDQRAEAALLAAASPLRRAAELKIPLLIEHGGQDRRVPIDHSRKFVQAARDAGVAVEYHVYAEEGHGFWSDANRIEHYRRLGRFLTGALRAPRAAAPATSAAPAASTP